MKALLNHAPALSLAEAQAIAEGIVGPVRWQQAVGWCVCPGIGRHTTRNAGTDCKVVCAPIAQGGGTLAPGIYCFHGSCAREVEAASFALRSALGKRTLPARGRARSSPARRPAKPPEPVFDPA